ncbi:MAG: hypothetical protein TEF_08755 [Rhizobiales bacterium NRL2]|jgi:glycosyltransferase involved in cell wall biosynthesis/tetratricopeptide (TPR) repeat protein|nr:MAG: hypothetical protein TEF_08755 [Rhizobiales bacterium NRL2]
MSQFATLIRRVQGWFSGPPGGPSDEDAGNGTATKPEEGIGPQTGGRAPATAPGPEQRRRRELRDVRRAGIAANRERDWRQAAAHWGRLTTLDPADAAGHVQYVKALTHLGDLGQAAAAADFALDTHPDHEELLHRRIRLLERLKQTDAIRRHIESDAYRAAARQSGRLNLQAGRHYWAQGDARAARPWLEAASAFTETRASADLYLARLEYRLGEYEASRLRWQAMLTDRTPLQRPEEPLLFLGRIALRRGEPEIADDFFEQAVTIVPETAGRIRKWRSAFTEPAPGVDDAVARPDTDLPAAAGLDAEADQSDLFPAPENDIEAGAGAAPEVPNAPPAESAPEPATGPEVDFGVLDSGTIAEAQDETADAERKVRLVEARWLFEADRLQEAYDEALSLFESDADDAEAAELLGFAANRTQQWRTAALAWGRLAELQPSRAGPRIQAAYAWQRAGDSAAALPLAEAALAADPGNPAIRMLLVQICSARGDLDRLREVAAAIDPGESDLRLLLALADAHVVLGDRGGARPWAERALEHHRDSVDAKLRMARLLYGAGELEAAETLWRELLDAPKDRVRPFEPRIFLARCAGRRGDLAETVAFYREALTLNPDHLDSREALVNALLRLGELAEAEHENQEIRRRAPDSPYWPINNVLIAYRHGDRTEIARRYDEAMQFLTGDRISLVRLGRTLESQHDHEAALAHWERMKSAWPRDPDIQFRYIVRLSAAGGDIPLLDDLVQELLHLEPDHEGGLQYRYTLSERLGRLDEAEEICQRGLDLYPANPTFWAGRIKNLMSADKIAEARRELERARQHLATDSARGLAESARLAELADIFEEARELLAQAVAMEPGNLDIRRRAIRFELYQGAYGRVWEQAVEARRRTLADDTVNAALAQAATVMAATYRDWPRTPPEQYRDLLVPDDVYGAICAGRWPRPAGPEREGRAMLVTSTLGSGGSERQVMYTMRGLAANAHDFDSVELAVRSLDPYQRRDFFLPSIRELGGEIFELAGEDLFDQVRALGREALPHREAIRLAAVLPQEIQAVTLPLLGLFLRRRPDVVHLWQDTINIAGGLAALMAGVPRIVMGTRSTRPDARRRLRRYLLPGYREMLRLPQITMVNNSHNGARDYEDWIGLPEGTIRVIHNGFDVTQLRGAAEMPAEARALGIPADAVVIGGVMRFSEEKRPELFVDTAIELAGRLPEAHFLLIGDGPLRPELLRLVRERGLADRIHLPGAKRPIEPWMRMMSLLLLTSRMEGLPNVLIEAQLLGVPVAATDVGGAKETMVADKTGILIDSGDPTVLAGRLFELLSDRGRMTAMAEEAGRWAPESFSLAAMTGATLRVYAETPADSAP